MAGVIPVHCPGYDPCWCVSGCLNLHLWEVDLDVQVDHLNLEMLRLAGDENDSWDKRHAVPERSLVGGKVAFFLLEEWKKNGNGKITVLRSLATLPGIEEIVFPGTVLKFNGRIFSPTLKLLRGKKFADDRWISAVRLHELPLSSKVKSVILA